MLERIILDLVMNKVMKDKNKINIHDFYTLYKRRKRSYDSSFLPYEDNRKQSVEKKLYMNIVRQYQDNWYRSLMRTKGSIYFPLGGEAKKVLYRMKANLFGTKNRETRFGIFWYKRISARSYFFMAIKKIRGTGVKIYEMEKNFVKFNNLDYMPKFEDEIKDKKEKQILFRTHEKRTS